MLDLAHPLYHLTVQLSLRAPLSEKDRDAVGDLPYTLKSLDPGSYIVREGDLPEQCGVIAAGFAIRQKVSGDGGRQILGIHLRGDAVDFQNIFLDVSDHNVQMLTGGEVAFVERREFQQLMRERAAVGHAVLVQILAEAAILREWILNIGQRKARERVAHLLCELGYRLDAIGIAEEYGYELPMTQEELGDATGLTAVHVNRTLKALEAEGIITRKKRLVSFPDWRRMREMADFSDRYLHMQVQASP